MALSHRQLLHFLSRMPFVDSVELALILGEPHATTHLPSSQRYYLTSHGIRKNAEMLDLVTPSDFVRAYPVAREWLISIDLRHQKLGYPDQSGTLDCTVTEADPPTTQFKQITVSFNGLPQDPGVYTVKLRGCMEVDSCGKHGSAGILSVMMPPPPPQNLTPTVSSPTVVNLSWDAVSFVSGYGISFRHFDPNSGWTGWTVSQVFLTTTGATVSNLQAGTLYEFRVRAKGDGNEYDNTWGPWSGSEQITTPTS